MLSTANKDLLRRIAIQVAFGAVAVIADTVSRNLAGLNIPASYAAIIGLFAGTISQWAHTHYDLGGRIARAVVPRRFRS